MPNIKFVTPLYLNINQVCEIIISQSLCTAKPKHSS